MRSMKDKVKITQVENPATVTASGKSDGVDMQDFNSLLFLVSVGTFTFTGTDKLTITVEHADVDTDGSYAACAAADLYDDAETPASGIAKVLDGTEDQNMVHVVGYRGNKRYVRLNITEGGTVSVILSAVAVRGDSELQPPL